MGTGGLLKVRAELRSELLGRWLYFHLLVSSGAGRAGHGTRDRSLKQSTACHHRLTETYTTGYCAWRRQWRRCRGEQFRCGSHDVHAGPASQ